MASRGRARSGRCCGHNAIRNGRSSDRRGSGPPASLIARGRWAIRSPGQVQRALSRLPTFTDAKGGLDPSDRWSRCLGMARPGRIPNVTPERERRFTAGLFQTATTEPRPEASPDSVLSVRPLQAAAGPGTRSEPISSAFSRADRPVRPDIATACSLRILGRPHLGAGGSRGWPISGRDHARSLWSTASLRRLLPGSTSAERRRTPRDRHRPERAQRLQRGLSLRAS